MAEEGSTFSECGSVRRLAMIMATGIQDLKALDPIMGMQSCCLILCNKSWLHVATVSVC